MKKGLRQTADDVVLCWWISGTRRVIPLSRLTVRPQTHSALRPRVRKHSSNHRWVMHLLFALV